MNPDDPSSQEELLAALLAAYDESLAVSAVPPAPAGNGAPPTLAARIQEDLACLQLLHQLRPRQPAAALPTAEGRDAEPSGRYTLVRLQAIGGIGRVWVARDLDLDREVALKELRPEKVEDATLGERFLREARITGQLQHPGIVPVYELVPGAGDEQQPYYTMRFVQGRTLTEAAREYHEKQKTSSFNLLALLNAFVSVCHTVAYAHSRGVIHRDLKGQNVVLGDFGEVIVLDWGFAKVLGDAEEPAHGAPAWEDAELDADHTLAGQVLGTPAYMAPEQAAGHLDQIDQRTDVYGLGAILYEILTGQPPFQGDDTQEVLRKVREEEPVRPRQLGAWVPPPLEDVCLRALARQPAERYACAAELAHAIRQWLADEPVAGYREPVLARGGRWARRHKQAVTGGVVLSATAVVALLVSTFLIGNERARTAAAREQVAEAKATAAARIRRELELHLYFQNIALAERELTAHNLSRATQLLDSCPVELRDWEWDCLNRLCHADVLTLQGHRAAVACVAFSPDGQRLASASHDNTVKIWDSSTGKVLLTFEAHSDAVYGVAFSPDGRHVASASWDGTARVWDAGTGTEQFRLHGHDEAVQRVAYSPDGRLLATLSMKRLLLWDARTGERIRTLLEEEQPLYGLAFSPDSTLLAVSHQEDKSVRLYDMTTFREVRSLSGYKHLVKPLAFSPDGRLLVSGAGDLVRNDPGEVRLWQLDTGDELAILTGHTDPIYSVAFSPNGRRLVSASQDSTVKIWDPAAAKEVLTLRGHKDTVRCVAFSPDGRRLASAGADEIIKIWDATPGTDEKPAHEIYSLEGHNDRVFSVVFSRDGGRLASVSDEVIKVWDARTGQELDTHPVPTYQLYAVDFSPDGRYLAAATNGGRVLIVEATTGRLAQDLVGPTDGPIRSLMFSRDGRRLACASWERLVWVWDLDSGRLKTLAGHTEPVIGVALSSDGRRLASASFDQTVKIWDAQTAQALHTLVGHASRVLSVAFSPSDKYLASASNDGTVRVWDTTTWQAIHILH
ncbi:MAG: serine/threonine protein kinase, partial [Gemmataceae bacterium]|nr:serine/threonine protein kinase [Gemmataceae bacterium]